MNFKKKLWLGSSLLALMSHGTMATAVELDSTWQARPLDVVLNEVVVTEDNQVKYTVKYGDTLSVISEAMTIELKTLAQINDIENIDVIFPETVLTAQFDANQQAESLTVESPDGESIEVAIPVNLSSVSEVEDFQNGGTVEEAATVNETTQAIGSPAAFTTEVPAWIESTEVEEEVVVEETTEIVEEVEVIEATPIVEEPAIEVEPVIEEEITEAAPIVEVEPVVEEVITEAAPIVEAEPAVEEEIIAEAPIVEEPIAEVISEIEEENFEEPIEEVVTEIEETIIEEPIVEEAPVIEEEIIEEVIVEEPIVEEPIIEEPAPAYDPMSNPENAGLQPHVAEYKEEVAEIYGVDSFSLYRPGDSQDHGQGLAADFIVPVGSQVGDDIANYSVDNMAANNISYVIWEQQIYGDWSNTWEMMEDRGNATANHYDHVHVSFNP